MSVNAAGPILPVVNLGINYDEEREKIGDFLQYFKAPAYTVPPIHAAEDAMDGGADGDAAFEPDEMVVDDDGARVAKRSVMVEKYMVQLVREFLGTDTYATATHRESRPGYDPGRPR